MRFVVCHPGPSFSVADVYAGWVEALEQLGHQVIPFNLHDRLVFYDGAYFNIAEGQFRKALPQETAVELAVNGLYSCLYKTRPDVLLVVSAFLVPVELLDLARRYRTRVVVLHTETPYEDTRQLAVAAHADLNLLNDPVSIERYRELAPTHYLPHAYRPTVHRPGPAEPHLAADLAFVGTGFESRIAFFEAMDRTGLDLLLAGHWQRLAEDSPLRKHVGHDIAECLDNAEAVRIYRSAKIGLNLYRREVEDGDSAAGWAMGPREVEMAAVGLPFLREPRGEGDELLPMLPRFGSPAEAGELARWWLAHEDLRVAAAAEARQAVADRTFADNAARMLRLLEGVR
jgi:hypothetical protein